MKQHPTPHQSAPACRAFHATLAFSRRRAFTLTELMVAVSVLIVVIIATSKIFGTASRITAVGTSTASVMTEAATIERRMREDISKLTPEGFFAIHCVAVRNDVNVAAGGPLLNANLPPTAIIRADQLVFFAIGVDSAATYRMSAGNSHKSEGLASRVYYGHAFQLREALPAIVSGNTADAHDPAHIFIVNTQHAESRIYPWFWANASMVRTPFEPTGGAANGTDIFNPVASTTVNGRQPEARQWILARQPVLLIDDDQNAPNVNSKTVYQSELLTARSIFLGVQPAANFGHSREIRNGRADAAASTLNLIRRWVTSVNLTGIFSARPWDNSAFAVGDQRRVISLAVYYPRAERVAPSMGRVDQALTNHVIGEGCSSFAIDWTYDGTFDGTGTNSIGYVINGAGVPFRGVGVNPGVEQPWFGLVDDNRGVQPYSALPAPPPWPTPASIPIAFRSETISGANIEIIPATPIQPGVLDYWAVFGYNQFQSLNLDPTIDPDPGQPGYEEPYAPLGYTPFPSAIRVTMTLHDAEGRLEAGREVQFVIRLPRRVK